MVVPTIAINHFGGRSPGGLAHSSMWDGLSDRHALFGSLSHSGPEGRCLALSLASLPNEARRPLRERSAG